MRKIAIALILIIAAIVVGISPLTLAADITPNKEHLKFAEPGFDLVKLGLVNTPADTMPSFNYLSRGDNSTELGYYIMPPASGLHKVSSDDKKEIQKIVKAYLEPAFYNDDIFDYFRATRVSKFSPEREFYCSFYSDNIPMIISGVYNKLTHIIIFTVYNGPDDFALAAEDFFDIPSIDGRDVKIESYKNSHDEKVTCYTVEDMDDNWNLNGYELTQIIEPKPDQLSFRKYNVLDLTIYASKRPIGNELFAGYPDSTGMNINTYGMGAHILFTLIEPDTVSFAIFDMNWDPVRRYGPLYYEAGNHELIWDLTNDSGKPVDSAVYFLRMIVGEGENAQTFMKKVVVLE